MNKLRFFRNSPAGELKHKEGIQEAILQKNRRIEDARRGIILSVIRIRWAVGNDGLRNRPGKVKDGYMGLSGQWIGRHHTFYILRVPAKLNNNIKQASIRLTNIKHYPLRPL